VRVALVWLGVGLLGGLGALLRFVVDRMLSARTTARLPVGTFVVNVSGAIVLGLLVGLGVRGSALLLAGTGLLGAYTTFSTWMLESHRAGEDGRLSALGLNLGGSLTVGLGAAWLGHLLGGGS
jgi:CrcB protein